MQRQMRTLQWLELSCGTAAGAPGLLGLGDALFGQLALVAAGLGTKVQVAKAAWG